MPPPASRFPATSFFLEQQFLSRSSGMTLAHSPGTHEPIATHERVDITAVQETGPWSGPSPVPLNVSYCVAANDCKVFREPFRRLLHYTVISLSATTQATTRLGNVAPRPRMHYIHTYMESGGQKVQTAETIDGKRSSHYAQHSKWCSVRVY
jgi:hypothetical protein